MRKSFCVAADLVGGLQLSDRELCSMMKGPNGEELPAHEIRQAFVAKLREGFDVYPPCDHHDEKGHCLGHPMEDETTEEGGAE